MSESNQEKISIIDQQISNSSFESTTDNCNNENENENKCCDDVENQLINLQLIKIKSKRDEIEIKSEIDIETMPNISMFNVNTSLLLPTTITTDSKQQQEEINENIEIITSESNSHNSNTHIDNNDRQLELLIDDNFNTTKNLIKPIEILDIKNDNCNDDNNRIVEHSILTEKSIQDCRNLSSLMMEQSKEDSVLEYLNSVDTSTIIDIQDKLIDNDIVNSESEEDDQLKPLIIDNHTTVDYHEYYTYPPLIIGNNDNNNDVIDNQNYELNKNVARSITDSDLSTQYDHQDLTNLSQNSDDFKDNNNSDQQENHHHHNQQQQQQRPPLTTTPTSEILSEIKEIDTLSPLEIPDDRLCIDIVEQVEFYFSNDSILKDAFLLKHVRRNKEGFVSLKLVSSFKRVRQYTKDWRVVGNAINRKSRKIELNDLGTKIRRIEPLPTFDETMPSRTIVASDLPFEKLCIEKVTEIFTKYGEIELIRILRPGMTIPIDVRQFMNKYPEMQQKECALIEYIDSQSARQAKDEEIGNSNCKVFDMVAPKKKTGKKSVTTITKFIENYKYSDNNYEKSRGGGGGVGGPGIMINKNSNNTDIDYRLNRFRRTSSDYLAKTEQHQQQPNHNFIYQPPHMMVRRHSTQDNNIHYHNNNINNNNNMNLINEQNMMNKTNNNNNINFTHYPPRRISNCSINSNNNDIHNNMSSRKYSSCSEGYSSCSDMSRRTSSCSSSDHHHHHQQQQQQNLSRRSSNCSSEHCPCSRKVSQCSAASDSMFRKISQCSEHSNNSRRFSNVSYNHGYDRTYSNPTNNDGLMNNNNNRRISMDSNYERKISTDSLHGNNYNNGNHYFENPFRKYSTSGFDPMRKLSNSDQYYNGRRISTDSGYDRKFSFSSDYSTSTSPRSRTNSFIINTCPHNKTETVVRTPIGPDGTKGFSSRIRKVGHVTVQPVN